VGRFRGIASSIVDSSIAPLVGFRVEMHNSSWPRMNLPEWLFYLAPQTHIPIDLPTYSAPFWALAGSLIGAPWTTARRHD
jgi:hypothetical protein